MQEDPQHVSRLLAALLVLSFASDAAAQSAYIFSDLEYNHAAAEAYCVSQYSGHLVTLNNLEEAEWLLNKQLGVDTHGEGKYWCGLWDTSQSVPRVPEASDNAWQWTSGEAGLSYPDHDFWIYYCCGYGPQGGYSEPTCGYLDNDQSRGYRGRTVSNDECSTQRKFVCEVDASPVCPSLAGNDVCIIPSVCGDGIVASDEDCDTSAPLPAYAAGCTAECQFQEFLLPNTGTAGSQRAYSVARLGPHKVVATWRSTYDTQNKGLLWAKIMDDNGAELVPDFPLSEYGNPPRNEHFAWAPDGLGSTTAALGTNKFVVVYESGLASGYEGQPCGADGDCWRDIVAKVFDDTGSLLTHVTVMNRLEHYQNGFNQYWGRGFAMTRVAALGSDRFVVVWVEKSLFTEANGRGGWRSIVGAVYSASGALVVPPFILSAIGNGGCENPHVVATGPNEFAAVWMVNRREIDFAYFSTTSFFSEGEIQVSGAFRVSAPSGEKTFPWVESIGNNQIILVIRAGNFVYVQGYQFGAQQPFFSIQANVVAGVNHPKASYLGEGHFVVTWVWGSVSTAASVFKLDGNTVTVVHDEVTGQFGVQSSFLPVHSGGHNMPFVAAVGGFPSPKWMVAEVSQWSVYAKIMGGPRYSYTAVTVDECAGDADCTEHATCVDHDKDFQLTCECNRGYEWDGPLCVDVDECAQGTSSCARSGANCTNTEGSFTCSCLDGFEGDGLERGLGCPDINECNLQVGLCDAKASCRNQPGTFACGCNAGYVGDGHVQGGCRDVDLCTVCAPGEENEGCGGDSNGVCDLCETATYKTSSGSGSCLDCNADCAPGTEKVGCGGTAAGSCDACSSGMYKEEAGPGRCQACTAGAMTAIASGRAVEGADLKLPVAYSYEEEDNERYVLQENKDEDGYYTLWRLEDATGPFRSADGDFTVSTRVLFENLGGTDVTFVFLDGEERQEFCFDCRGGTNFDSLLVKEGAWETLYAYQEVLRADTIQANTWYDIELRREGGELHVAIDGEEVWHDAAARFDFAVSGLAWRAWGANLRIASLALSFNNLYCVPGFEHLGCGGASAGSCELCGSGRYKAEGGTGPCLSCADIACATGQALQGCGGDSAGACEWTTDNECERHTDTCDDELALCIKVDGSFECECLSGYEGAGTVGTCVDVDECSEASHNCDLNAACDNAIGGFNCTCNAGFDDGDGTEGACVAEWASPEGGGNLPAGGRSGMCVASTGAELLVFGGEDAVGALLNDLLQYDAASSSWSALPNLAPPSPRRAMGCSFEDGRLWVLSGETAAGSTNDMYEYDVAQQEWSVAAVQGGVPPSARRGLGLAGGAGKLFVFGGCCHAGANDLHQFDIAARTWAALPELGGHAPPAPRHSMALVLVGERLLVWGGVGTDGGLLADLHAYALATGSWAPLQPSGSAPAPRGGAGAVALGPSLLVFGGEGEGGAAMNDLCEYHAADDQWTCLPLGPAPPTERHSMGFGQAQGKLVVFGGRGDNGLLSDVFELFLDDPCGSGAHNCDENAECSNSREGGFACACKEGFIGAGVQGTCCDGGYSSPEKCWKLVSLAGDGTYAGAQAACADWGGNLASFESEGEWAEVGSGLGLAVEGGAWLGVRREDGRSVWEHADGSQRLYDGAWGAGEPSGGAGGEARCVLAQEGAGGAPQWRSSACTATLPRAVCAKRQDGGRRSVGEESAGCDGHVEAHGKCWLGIGSVELSQQDAAAACEAWGGELASVRSEAEAEVVRQQLGLGGEARAWIGYGRSTDSEGWAWADGSQLRQWEGDQGEMWGTGQPGAASCATIELKDGRWAGAACDAGAVRHVVCSKLSDARCDGEAAGHGKCWVSASGVSESYSAAQAACSAWGGNLASILSAEEVELVSQQLDLSSSSELAWIGLRRASVDDAWEWEDKSQARTWWARAWGSGEPGSALCAALRGGASRTVMVGGQCSATAGRFVCSKSLAPWCDGNYAAHGKCWVAATDVKKTFAEAQTACVAWGGSVASVRSLAEQEALRADLRVGAEGQSVWIGLTRSSDSAVPPLMWDDGVASLEESLFSSAKGSSQDRCLSTQGSDWAFDACDETKGFVCSKFRDAECDGDLHASGKCWMRVSKSAGMSYGEGQAACEAWGGTLATIQDEAEEKDLQSIAGQADFWLGLRRESSRRVWKWADGTKRFLYSPGPPGALQSSSPICAVVRVAGGGFEYDEVPCDLESAVTEAMCSKYTDETRRVVTLPQSNCDGQVEGHGKCWYSIDKVGLSYHDAQAACEEWGGDLASVEDMEGEATLKRMGWVSGFWLGLRRESSARIWKWEDGSPRYRYMIGPPGELKSSGEICTDVTVREGVNGAEAEYGEGFCSRARDVVCTKQTGKARRVATVSECDGQFETQGKCWIAQEKVHMSYEEAEAACAEWNGTLASLLASSEATALSAIILEPGDFWVGLRRENSSAVWRWADGAPRFWNIAPPGKFETDDPLCMAVKLGFDEDGRRSNSYRAEECADVRPAHFACSKYLDGIIPTTLPNSNCDGMMESFGRCWIAHSSVYMTRDDAAAECRSWGGELASINTAYESLAVRDTSDEAPLRMGEPGNDYWIGLRRENSDSVFKWDYDGARRLGEGWMPFTPIDSKDPVCVWESGRWGWWRDDNCTHRPASFLCAKETIPLSNASNASNASSAPSTGGALGCNGNGEEEWNGKCWLLINDVYLGFDAAEAACQDWGGNLASVEDGKDSSQVRWMFQEYFPAGGGCWLGLRSAHSKQLWSWRDGAGFDYANWGEMIDNEPGRDALCAYTDYDELWRATNCLSKQPHVLCSKPLPDPAQAAATRRSGSRKSQWCDGTSQTGGRCWWLVNNPMTYDAAHLVCYQWGGEIASLTPRRHPEQWTAWGDVWVGLQRRQFCNESDPNPGNESNANPGRACWWTWIRDEGRELEPSEADWGDKEPSEDGRGKDCVQAGEGGWVSVPCETQVAKTLCSKEILACERDRSWCEVELAKQETGAVIVDSDCDCGCCFYYSAGETVLKRVGECSPMCSTLSLGSQNITALHQEVLDGLQHVRVLDLSNNDIAVLEDGCFLGTPGLSKLDLGGNQLSELREEVFSGLDRLVELDLRQNAVASLSNTSFGALHSLLLLSLGGNLIDSVEEGVFANLTSLLVLDLNRNQITSTEVIKAPPSLTALFLERNRIAALNETAFAGFQSVRYLQLNYNAVDRFERRTFERLPDVRSLGLAFNDLTGVEFGKLTYLMSLLRVMLRSNPLTCSPVLPDTVIEVDFISADPACLPIGCAQRFSETALAVRATDPFSQVAVGEALIPAAIEMLMFVTRRDNSQFLDSLSIARTMYSDYGLGERCWCTPVARCFPTPPMPCPPGTLGSPCGSCPVHHFCPGNNQSYPCPPNTEAPEGGARACRCSAGFVGADGGVCTPCPEGFWCPGGAAAVACGVAETSPAGSTVPENCTCQVGFGRCQSTYHPSAEYNSKCLSLRTPALPWHAARATCVEYGGDLMTINSQGDDAMVLSLVQTQADNNVWFGLSDLQSEGTFVLPSGVAATTFNWAPAPPPLPEEDCVSYSAEVGKTGWHDDDCAEPKPFLCALPTPAVCEDVDECQLALANCDQERSVCNNTVGSFICLCVDGWASDNGGVNCTINVDECAEMLDTCDENNAVCHDGVGSFTCQCKVGWNTSDAGVTCVDIDECMVPDDNNCDEDRAECKNTQGSFVCACDLGWTTSNGGVECVNIDECFKGIDDCSSNSLSCVDNPGSFTCSCRPGYSGTTCRDFAEVQDCTLGCDPNARCLAVESGGASCVCNAGYNQSGPVCEDLDECVQRTHSCIQSTGASCSNTNGSFVCTCPRGYGSETGRDCYVLDECFEILDNCDVNAFCRDSDDSFTCQCLAGWESLDGLGVECIDIDECSRGLHNCDRELATCNNTMGSFVCTCDIGWESLDGGVNCTDFDECDLGSSCPKELEMCVNSLGSFQCDCRTGYNRTNASDWECADIDECDSGSHDCTNAQCSNTIGSFTCACSPGFEDPADAVPGVACQNVDECTELEDACAMEATCSDTEGSFLCVCPSHLVSADEGRHCERCSHGVKRTADGQSNSRPAGENWVTCDCDQNYFGHDCSQYAPPSEPESEQVQAGEQAEVETPSAGVHVPPGATEEVITITVTSYSVQPTVSAAQPELEPMPDTVIVDFQPDGQTFLVAVEMVFAVNSTVIYEAALLGKVPVVAFWNTTSFMWQVQNESWVNLTAGTIHTYSSHFSLWCVMMVNSSNPECAVEEGFYCVGLTKTACPAGTYCKGRTAVPARCETAVRGLFCPAGDAPEAVTLHSPDGVPCPAGSFCPGGTNPPESCVGPRGFFCPAGNAGTALPQNTGGVACPVGYYCAGGIQPALPCTGAQRGYYCPAGDQTGASTPPVPSLPIDTLGVPCPAGYFCGGGIVPAVSCGPHASKGYYCPAGDSTEAADDLHSPDGVPCPAGSFCPGGTNPPEPCVGPRGFFCPAGNAGTALPQNTGGVACPVGYYCAGGIQPALPCTGAQRGYYCPAGDQTGASTPPVPSLPIDTLGVPCPAGYFCGGGIVPAVSCGPHASKGYYCPAGDSTEADALISADGVGCLAGWYCAGGEAQPTSCDPPAKKGFYCPAGDTAEAVPLTSSDGVGCPVGYFCEGGQAAPVSCFPDAPEGNYCPAGDSPAAVSLNSTIGVGCPPGYYCAGGANGKENCTSPEGSYCPYSFAPLTAAAVDGRRNGEGISPLDGTLCPAGWYCFGTTHDAIPCSGAEGMYCPAGFSPAASSPAHGAQGRRCPPGKYCAGATAEPVVLPPICDMVQSCGELVASNVSCDARQSTFYRLNKPPASFAVDLSTETCMKTANAIQDTNPQWLRIDMQRRRVVATVRFWSAGAAADFRVLVAGADAPWVRDEDGMVDENPSVGGAIPTFTEACEVRAASEGVLEATCKRGTMGRHLFITRSSPNAELEVCEVQAFDHPCLPQAEQLSCPEGFQPSACGPEVCPGCVPCPPGTFSDRVGPYPCSPCPGPDMRYGERPYSPEGATSVFHCEGTLELDSTSSLRVPSVAFNQSSATWQIDVVFSLGLRIQLNGLAAIFLSSSNAAAFDIRHFPCRSVESRSAAAADGLSHRYAETACCLADFRDTYVTTRHFRDYMDTLDLVAANDICDAIDGSSILDNAALDVVGPDGTVLVDTDGQEFANSIRVEPVGTAGADGDTGIATIFIPDAELSKVSRQSGSGGSDGGSGGSLSESRQLFVGLLDMLPTGTRVVESTSQQIAVELTRNRYGSFAAFGQHNVDYDFISFLNARLHRVLDHPGVANAGAVPGDAPTEAFYAEVSVAYHDGLRPVQGHRPVSASTVSVWVGTMSGVDACASLPHGFLPLLLQACGPAEVEWDSASGTDGVCPQLSRPEESFVRIYIPLQLGEEDSVRISFDLALVDAEGRNASLAVSMELATNDFVTWCDAAEASVDLADWVIPSLLIGSEQKHALRVFEPTGTDVQVWPWPAATLQDGLLTLLLELNETRGLDAGLEVFVEDVLVIHVNPGAEPDVDTILDGVRADTPDYLPTYEYNPATREAGIVLPPKLVEACPEEEATASFFGCVHKRVVADQEVVRSEDAFLLGSDGAVGAEDFMETMLGSGTAEVTARALGRVYEQRLVGERQLGAANPKNIGLWINPGHRWGASSGEAEYSLSQHVIVCVLFGVNAGAGGTRRALLRTLTGETASGRLAAVRYQVDAASVVQNAMPDAVVSAWRVAMTVAANEACLPAATLRAILGRRLQDALADFASAMRGLEVVSVRTEQAACGEGRRSEAPGAVAVLEVVVVLEDRPDAFIDWEALTAAGLGVLSARPADSSTAAAEPPSLGAVSGEADGGAGSQLVVLVGVLAGVVALGLVGSAVAWKAELASARRKRASGRPEAPLATNVSDWESFSDSASRPTAVVAHSEMDRIRIESMLLIPAGAGFRGSSVSHSVSQDAGQGSLEGDLVRDLSLEDLITRRFESLDPASSPLATRSDLSLSRSNTGLLTEVIM